VYKILVGKPEGKRPLGRPRRRWMDNIGMDLGEVGWGDVDLNGQAQDRNRWRALVNWVLNLQVPCNAGKLSSGLSSSAQLHRVSNYILTSQRNIYEIVMRKLLCHVCKALLNILLYIYSEYFRVN
jgi:hypothetical protein